MFEGFIYHLLITYGYIGIFLLMILQTILVVIPSEAVIALSGALGLETTKVIAIGTLGLLAGATIAFFISRYFGRKIVVKILGDEWLDEVDQWIEQNGTKAIFIARLVPLIPFDLISYVSGLTKMEFKKYIVATIIGMIPRIIFLVYLGETAKSILSIIGLGIDFIIIFGTLGIILIIYLDRNGHLNGLRNFVMKKVIKTKRFYRKKQYK
ncbi:MAG: VTT domain-containing protein [Candidatus Aenigmarchaeota archaeon]|nr:VTT domain-containing protein [Candidatus Aenigmarchaeota archaeon]MBU5688832.1 VTT domain-containing protein [Candidatus Aenigmarchaeota archaeon]